MSNLSQDLELLRELNESRTRAKELREQALLALKQVELENNPGEDGEYEYKDRDKGAPKDGGSNKEFSPIEFERWVAAGDDVEIALLVKVQNHRDLSERENENNEAINASGKLKAVLKDLHLKRLLQQGGDGKTGSTYPVLLAARAMQALVSRSETVFEPATLYCYYRIIRELYGVAQPNWTVGAARAGVGGTTSAFVTNECIRAIFAFERALKRTYTFFEQTRIFYEHFSSLKTILDEWDIKKGPLYEWANKSIEAMWLDCQIATNPRSREMALFYGERDGENILLLPDQPDASQSCIDNADRYFKSLPQNLAKALDQLFENAAEVYYRIHHSRKGEDPNITHPIKDLEAVRDPEFKGKYEFNSKRTEEDRPREEEISKFNRTATAHLYALRTIGDAVFNAEMLRRIVEEKAVGVPGGEKRDRTKEILEEMAKRFYTIRRRVHHVLEPSKQYLKMALDRELAAPPATFDAGELAFAATSYGAIHNWRLNDRLTRACERLVNSLPDTGRLPTKRPFHADRRGYRTIPIGCEMTRSLATLLQKTGYVFDAKFVGRMLGIFQENFTELHESTAKRKLIGWNFEGASDPDKPAVWVTAVSVLALDRIVRMLNTRINEIVLAHFDVTQPERPHTELRIRDLICSDYALMKKDFHEDDEKFTGIHLQKARAHVMRAALPKQYRENNKNFSTLYYGPPQTGKTTLAESLALSAKVPLLRLSPGDLILQGQELIEGRAHDVFEALSMLTQCVIIFDEFEPVLKNRRNETKSSLDPMARIGDLLENISEKDDPKFKFVLGGMLPKLIKLHDSANKQMFAYCLGTNYLKKIDLAAKRKGRFDKSLPVYKPDALTRAGALLYRLGQAKKGHTSGGARSDVELRLFFKTIARTVGEPADRLSRLFWSEKTDGGNDERARTLKYILNEPDEPPDESKRLDENFRTFEKEIQADSADKDEEEKKQCAWIVGYEKSVVDEAKNIDTKTGDEIITLLNECLGGHKVRVGKRRGKGSRQNIMKRLFSRQ